jgi:hypothetical protein
LNHRKEKNMMPVLRINDATFADISTLKTWFKTKSPSETIDLIVREAMEQLGIEHDDETEGAAVASNDGVLVFDAAPSLTFTKPMKATINGKPIKNPNWASILHAMIAQVKAKGFEGQKLVRELGIPSKAASYDDEGYKYISELGISVQGQSAADAWKEVDRLAKKWLIPVNVEFIWRQNPKAQHSGKAGILRSGSS